ncbi:MAG: RNA-dependent DNA polymerase, partial [Candidatus Staskawiczbacteria bacterium]|nr:RNA-dependent DNA polymerase [Candidatus Staskawiczbacteria bacterium]
DQFIKHKLKIKYYIRYCDDFVILSDDKFYLESLIFKVNDFLSKNLKLYLHPNKIIISKYHQGIDFLGYVIFPYHRILRTKTKNRMFKKVHLKVKEFNINKISKESLNQTMQSYFGVLKHCSGNNLKIRLLEILLNKR